MASSAIISHLASFGIFSKLETCTRDFPIVDGEKEC